MRWRFAILLFRQMASIWRWLRREDAICSCFRLLNDFRRRNLRLRGRRARCPLVGQAQLGALDDDVLDDGLGSSRPTKACLYKIVFLVARLFKWATSLTVSERNFPGATSSFSGPNWVRLIFSTWKPTD
jgi:hypothetical protein